MEVVSGFDSGCGVEICRVGNLGGLGGVGNGVE